MKKILISMFLLIFLTSCIDKVDERGFYIEGKNIGINKITKSIYDKEGYDINGYNKYGFDKTGYDKEGYNSLGFDENGINRRGYDDKGTYHNEYRFNKIMKEKGLNFESSKEFMVKRYSLKNTYMYSPGKSEFETTKDYKNRLKLDQKKYLNFLIDSYFVYNSGKMSIEYNADSQEMVFTVYSYEDIETIKESDGKLERKVKHFSLPFKSKEEYRLKMDIEEAKEFDRSKVKIKMIVSPLYEAIAGDTKVMNEYGQKEKIERNIDYDRRTDDYRSIIGYRIYDDNKIYYEKMMDIELREAFIKFAEVLIDTKTAKQQYYPIRIYKKDNKIHFIKEEYIKNSFRNKFVRYIYDLKTKKIIKDRRIENYTSLDLRREYKNWQKF